MPNLSRAVSIAAAAILRDPRPGDRPRPVPAAVRRRPPCRRRARARRSPRHPRRRPRLPRRSIAGPVHWPPARTTRTWPGARSSSSTSPSGTAGRRRTSTSRLTRTARPLVLPDRERRGRAVYRDHDEPVRRRPQRRARPPSRARHVRSATCRGRDRRAHRAEYVEFTVDPPTACAVDQYKLFKLPPPTCPPDRCGGVGPDTMGLEFGAVPHHWRLWLMDVGRRAVAVAAISRDDATAAELAALQGVIDSFRLDTPLATQAPQPSSSG